MSEKERAPRNLTHTLSDADRVRFGKHLVRSPTRHSDLINATTLSDCMKVAPLIAPGSVDLLFLDPPYNMTKKFGRKAFNKMPVDAYSDWLTDILLAFLPALNPKATVYICGDWLTSASIFTVASQHLTVRNRITWEREKGRGAKANWKNASEDIWFCTMGEAYTFNVDAVKSRRKVVAPYRNDDGSPRDWNDSEKGRFRDTHPSNLWTDITVPFWSMPENTEHPTQKSEKFLAKLLLASTCADDLVLDPFLGSGTTSVVARKLGRRFIGIEKDEDYALLAEKRLDAAGTSAGVQGYSDGVFWERNSLKAIEKNERQKRKKKPNDCG